MIELILIFTQIVILVILFLIVYYKNKYDWNDGICRKSGKNWISFDMDSSGAIGYKDNKGNYLWI